MIEIVILILALIGALFAWVMVSAKRSMAYIFCNATISAWESKLLSEPYLVELAEAPGISDVISALEESEYHAKLTEVQKGGEVDIIAVEHALRAGLNRRYRELLDIVPEQRKEIILRLLQRVDLQNLKAIITMIHNKVPVEQRLQELIPSPTISPDRLEMLASARDLDSLLEFLRGTDQFNVISSVRGDYEKRGLVALLSALDRNYYSNLWQDARMKGNQRSVLEAMVGYEIDSVNVKLILRLRQEGVPRDEIDKYIVRPSYELTDAMVKEMIAAEDLHSAIHMIRITTQGKILSEALPKIEKQGIHVAERAVDEGYLRFCRLYEFTHLFSIAPVVSYIRLKENELRNLRAIIKLKADGAEPSRIKEKIVRVPKIEL